MADLELFESPPQAKPASPAPAATGEARKPRAGRMRREDKEPLLAELRALLNRVPPRVNSAGKQTTDEWLAACRAAARAANQRSGGQRIRGAIAAMQSWWG